MRMLKLTLVRKHKDPVPMYLDPIVIYCVEGDDSGGSLIHGSHPERVFLVTEAPHEVVQMIDDSMRRSYMTCTG